ncbi:hypothetical protein [Allomesorhizobium camelthorni]|uniref:Uncharacterized protein n=1 Tax=Allomesorhizobium camelthorni TaxID=475069 RepID=A0A6G4WFJ1_9HYPH|nr:hypothetical protein [Mesorhizobium camelthorni]NGO52996.1 hypothetical protein [Mesorhizobium camelthorni]
MWMESDRLGEVEEFDHVNMPTSRFDGRDKRLIPTGSPGVYLRLLDASADGVEHDTQTPCASPPGNKAEKIAAGLLITSSAEEILRLQSIREV